MKEPKQNNGEYVGKTHIDVPILDMKDVGYLVVLYLVVIVEILGGISLFKQL